MTLGEKIKKLRQSKGISQEVLARDININRNYLSRIETGLSEPSSSVLISLANYFNTSIDSLLELNKNNVDCALKKDMIIKSIDKLESDELDFLIRLIMIMKK